VKRYGILMAVTVGWILLERQWPLQTIIWSLLLFVAYVVLRVIVVNHQSRSKERESQQRRE
jgi:membrane protein implicated in regulation of membrane protease activity